MFFFLMRRRLPGAKRAAPLFPYSPLCRSVSADPGEGEPQQRLAVRAGNRRQSRSEVVWELRQHFLQQAAGHRATRPHEDVDDGAFLDDAAGLEHDDTVAEIAYHRHLVGDEADGEAEDRKSTRLNSSP